MKERVIQTAPNYFRSDDFLLQQVVINSGFREPRSYNLRTLQSCLRDAALPDYLLGRDSQIWEEPAHRGDLMSLDPSGGEDAMTVWISANLVAPFHTVLGKHLVKPSDSVAGLYNYSDRAITKISSLIATVLSSVLPIVGVIVLYFVADTLARIGIIAAMTALFSCCLALLTAAKKSEIFAATAAYVFECPPFLGGGSTYYSTIHLKIFGVADIPKSQVLRCIGRLSRK